jgi:hypothetical protein
MNTATHSGFDPVVHVNDGIVPHGTNRAQRRAAASKRWTTIQKKTPFGRVRNSYFNEATGKLVMRHATRGWSSRQCTTHFMDELLN